MAINWFVNILLLITFVDEVILNENNEAYGPYVASWDKFETCRSPKKTNCGNITITNTRNMSNVIFILDISKDCPLTKVGYKAKVAMGTVKQSNNATKKLWNYKLNNPCQHFVLGPLLATAFKLSSRCMISRGHYEVAINMHEISANFLGRSFFYDTYYFKVMVHNERNNFICVYSVMKISPK